MSVKTLFVLVSHFGKRKDKTMYAEDFEEEDLFTFLLFSFRYCLGRMSYAVSLFERLFDRYIMHLESAHRKLILEELERELQLAKQSNRMLGMKCDHEIWQRLNDKWASELEDLRQNEQVG